GGDTNFEYVKFFIKTHKHEIEPVINNSFCRWCDEAPLMWYIVLQDSPKIFDYILEQFWDFIDIYADDNQSCLSRALIYGVRDNALKLCKHKSFNIRKFIIQCERYRYGIKGWGDMLVVEEILAIVDAPDQNHLSGLVLTESILQRYQSNPAEIRRELRVKYYANECSKVFCLILLLNENVYEI